MKLKKITVTHRGTYESIKQKQKNMMLPANYSIQNNSFLRLCEDIEKVVWVSKGKPSWWNKVMSGMLGKKGKASVTFEIEENRLREPNGIIKKWFGGTQLVIEGDVKIPENAVFRFNEK
ncbi:hypothetical protein [Bacillus mycoides]|uniref:hypothetical protein n=1 Tax=Bacillus mycoides TaxID=1405 RepID=UPI000B4AAD50|nr:hypothetical protein [Bacillus mycoides]